MRPPCRRRTRTLVLLAGLLAALAATTVARIVNSAAAGPTDPVATADAAALEEDGGPAVVDVLANDTDPDGDQLTIVSAANPEHGAVSVSPGGSSVFYVPEVDFAGTDSFTYTISGGNGGTATGSVSVLVEPANDDPDVEDDAVTTWEDTPVAVDVLVNDEDVEGDVLAVTSVEGAKHGGVAIGPGGVTYEPESDFNGTDSFGYTVSDGNGSETGEVVVTVTAANDG